MVLYVVGLKTANYFWGGNDGQKWLTKNYRYVCIVLCTFLSSLWPCKMAAYASKMPVAVISARLISHPTGI